MEEFNGQIPSFNKSNKVMNMIDDNQYSNKNNSSNPNNNSFTSFLERQGSYDKLMTSTANNNGNPFKIDLSPINFFNTENKSDDVMSSSLNFSSKAQTELAKMNSNLSEVLNSVNSLTGKAQEFLIPSNNGGLFSNDDLARQKQSGNLRSLIDTIQKNNDRIATEISTPQDVQIAQNQLKNILKREGQSIEKTKSTIENAAVETFKTVIDAQMVLCDALKKA
mmetsp:Transcript_23384/g.20325  ORF Transcript_23384/g.20325 Transcript_23384/m.20325 type:complete len:222 (+) Transcript_23384:618-1283(+)